MTTKKFGDDLTHWDKAGGFPGAESGWRPPGEAWTIGRSDPYWGQLLERAKKSYGDPNIHFSTGEPTKERYLVFGDGARVPADGSLAYRADGKTYLANDDGTFALQKPDGSAGPPIPPAGWKYNKNDGTVSPVDDHGKQIGAAVDNPPSSPNGYELRDGMYTPKNSRGDYYQDDPATGERKYFDGQGKPITKEQYEEGLKAGSKPSEDKDSKGGNGSGGAKPLQSTKVDVPNGMTEPAYPQWALDTDPDIPNQMTGVLAKLFSMFGSGTPDTSGVPDFPFNPTTGEKSGIDKYDDEIKKDFIKLSDEFSSAAKAFNKVIQESAVDSAAGKDAINKAISSFNSAAKVLPSGKWDQLLQAEIDLITSAQQEVEKAATRPRSVQPNPELGPSAPGAPGPAGPGGPGSPNIDDLLQKLSATNPNPLGNAAQAAGNPLGAIPGMLGNPMGGGSGGGMSPLSAAADAAKPLAKLGDDDGKGKVKPLEPIDKKSPVSPLNPEPALQPPAAPPAAQQPPAGKPAVAVPAGNSKPTVSLPDGNVVPAPSEKAAQAARNALDDKGTGGDAALRAYRDLVDLPSDGKNLGAKVDPADVQAGDVLKWADKTMVAVGPGLIADPLHPGEMITLQEALKDSKGFEGIFRPTDVDPTLSSHVAADPVHPNPPAPNTPAAPASPPVAPHDQTPPPQPSTPPAQPATPPTPQAPPPPPPPGPGPGPENSIPLSGHGAPPEEQAPPSPFPKGTRSTKAERIAAGQQ